jgi:hypothetical protein
MCNAVIEVVKAHQPLWEQIPGFVNTFGEYEARVQVLRNRSGIQKSVTTGVGAQKRNRLEYLYEHLLVVQSALWVYAQASNNFLLMERNKVTISDLRHLSITRLDLHLDQVFKDVEEFGAYLTDFGITAEYLQETIDLINAGSNNATRPRMAIIERKMMTQSLDTIIRELDVLLKLRMDKLMLVFRVSQPEFYNRYRNARVIIDHRGPTASHGSEEDVGE